MPSVQLSLIVPTRGRPEALGRLLVSLCASAADLSRVEVVLVADEDAVPAVVVPDPRLGVRTVVGPPGRTMGALNAAGHEAARGDLLMLLNDDVVARTPGWDDRLLDAAAGFPDGVVLVHVNDTLMRHHLCTFPLLSRMACDLMGGVCPRDYVRYRIDDHIEDVFNLLGALGERRIVYLPDVVFEHANAVELPGAVREYHADPAVLALDAPLFLSLHAQRKQAALRLAAHIEARRGDRLRRLHESRLECITDPFSLRQPSRLRIVPPTLGPAEASPRVGVVLLTAEASERRSLDAVFGDGRVSDVTVVPPGAGAGRRLNELCRSSRADYLVLMDGAARPSAGWLDGLLACMHPGVAAVAPLVRHAGTAGHGGLVFAPDDSGRLSASAAPPGVVPAVSFCSPLVLLDRARVEQVLADEGYGRYFLDCDLALRCREQGWQVVVTPEVAVEVPADAAPPHARPLDEAAFEVDRLRFVRLWTASGRLDRLAPAGQGTGLLPHLQPRRPDPPPGRVAALAARLTKCWKERGALGLLLAGTRRLARMAPRAQPQSVATGSLPVAGETPPDAADCLPGTGQALPRQARQPVATPEIRVATGCLPVAGVRHPPSQAGSPGPRKG